MNTDNNAYAMFYQGIERANLAIEGIRKYGNIENNRDMAQLLGEALTLRAVIYNDLHVLHQTTMTISICHVRTRM